MARANGKIFRGGYIDPCLDARIRHHMARNGEKSLSECVAVALETMCDLWDEWERWDCDERDPHSPYYSHQRGEGRE